MTKGLKEGELLHDATNFIFENPKLVGHKKRVESELLLIARPVPASGLQKWQVGLHNSVNKKQKEKGLGRWVQRQIGKPPVLYDETKANRSRAVMEKHLQDIGYFGSAFTMDTLTKGKKVTLNYRITSRGQYVIRNVHYPADTLPLTHLLDAEPEKRLLKTNKPYSLAQLEAERARLTALANDMGYYEITKDNFFYFVDTTAGNFQTDIHLRLKQTGDSSIYQTYFLGSSWVFPDFSLERRGQVEAQLDTIQYNNLHIVQKEKVLRPTVLGRLVYQDSVAMFSKKEQQQTINRLLNLGIYKFANLRFDKEVRQDSHFLVRSVSTLR